MKNKSIIFLLVLALSFMFLSCVSANESVDVQASDNVASEPLASNDDIDTLSSYTLEDTQVGRTAVDDSQSTQNISDVSNQSSKDKISENNISNQNTINRSIFNYSERKELNILFNNITHLSRDDYKKVVSIMKAMEEEDFDECYDCMKQDSKKLLHILNVIGDEEYYTLYMIVWDIIHGDHNHDEKTSKNNVVKSLSPHLNSKNYEGRYIKSYKKYQNSYNKYKNSYKHYNRYTLSDDILEKYLFLNDLIDDYLSKQISLDEFLDGLKSIGYNIDDLVFNDDDTISWREATIPAPYDMGADHDVSYDDKVNVNELEENTNDVEEQHDVAVSSTPENSITE